MIPIKSAQRTITEMQDLEAMAAKLLEAARKLPAGPIRRDLLPAGRPWTFTDDYMLRKLLASGMKPRLIAPKIQRSIGAVQARIYLLKKPRKRQEGK